MPKADFAKRNFYDVWLPTLSPSETLVKQALAAKDSKDWKKFERAFLKEMSRNDPSKVLDLLAALSQHTNFSLGCYCEDESRCHRSVLRALLKKRKAKIV